MRRMWQVETLPTFYQVAPALGLSSACDFAWLPRRKMSQNIRLMQNLQKSVYDTSIIK